MATNGKDGEEIRMIIPGSKIVKAKSWEPELGEPPLSSVESYNIVKQWSVSNLVNFDGIEIEEVSLKKYGCSPHRSKKPYWYYQIEYSALIDGNILWGSANWLVVLMSGEVIAPVKD